MRVLVCGDRHWTDRDSIRARLSRLPTGTIIIEGEAPGADTLAREVAEELGLEVRRFPAQWDRYGRAAGPVRNRRMLEEQPDLVIAFHHDLSKSRGTANMVQLAARAGVTTEIHGAKEGVS